MTAAGVKAYRRMNPGSKLKTAVTGKVKKVAKRLNVESHFALEVQDKLRCTILIVKKRQTKEFVRLEGDGNVRKMGND